MRCLSFHKMESSDFDSRLGGHYSFALKAFATVSIVCLAWLPHSFAQQRLLTSHSDNLRTGASLNETLLAPGNVSKNNFGRLFSTPVDYQVLAQPLYVPSVSIAGGIHNVLYVVTQADSVYAIDADNGTQLWSVNFTNPAQGYPTGLTTASGAFLPCGNGPGFTQEGIVGTPVIDPGTNTIYMVAKTLQNATTVRHDLHALDISTGAEKFGGPVQIAATSTSLKGKVVHFNSLHQKNRPGLLLQNGVLYMGFGSNYCNDSNTGWVLSYDPISLQQLGSFNTSPDIGLTSIWQSGAGLAGDPNGFVYAETGESGNYDVPLGGQSFCNSVLKLSPTTAALADYFTPWSVAFLNSHDLDLSSAGVLLLPDQLGPFPHELVATGKQGIVYVLNRDSLGGFAANDSQIIQEFSLTVAGEMFGSPAYWNGTVYFSPGGSPLQAFTVSNGLLVPSIHTTQNLTGSHSPSISANGNTNGILWVINGGQLWAFDAVSLKLLYTSTQAGLRDTLPPLPHFVTQTAANGRVYVGTQKSIEAYGLFHVLSVNGGNNQSARVGTTLPLPVKVQAANPYSGQPDPGITVTFSDGGKGGTFNPLSAVTDANGSASTTYTLPLKSGTYTLTASAPTFGNVTATETALPGPAAKIIAFGGAGQTGTVGTVLPKQIVAQARDINNNGVPGVTINFSAAGNGTLTPLSAVTDATGKARTTFQLPTKAGSSPVTASSTGLTSLKFGETAVAGSPTSASIVSGNNQTAPAGTQLPGALTVLVTDQYGNPCPNISVSFDDVGAGGAFLNPNPVTTATTGKASQSYTLPPTSGVITIHATVAGVANPATFTETAQ
jgi:outer membrane protein assembly factor BamB